jgi:hypothetical protein
MSCLIVFLAIIFNLLILCKSFPVVSVDTTTYDESKNINKSRRSLIGECIGSLSIISIIGGFTEHSSAATSSSSSSSSELDISKEKILNGYRRLNYLIDNWVEETTVCGRDDNPYVTGKGCERTPMKVMDYLGYRNVKDPLFRADKTLQKLEPLIPVNRFNDYLEAIEKWSEAAEEGNGMAFISSWGEANPGGGKDRVQLFIERARKNVIDSRDSLGVVIDILDLKP